MSEFVEVDCIECREPVEMPRPIHTECSDVEVEAPKPEDLERTIPESDLRELVEKWRQRDTEEATDDWAQAHGMCANELEVLLEE